MKLLRLKAISFYGPTCCIVSYVSATGTPGIDQDLPGILYQYNLTTGAATEIGPIGFDGVSKHSPKPRGRALGQDHRFKPGGGESGAHGRRRGPP